MSASEARGKLRVTVRSCEDEADRGLPPFLRHGRAESGDWLALPARKGPTAVETMIPATFPAYLRIDFPAWRVVAEDHPNGRELSNGSHAVAIPPDDYRDACPDNVEGLGQPVEAQFLRYQPTLVEQVLEALSPRVDRSEGSVMHCAFWEGGSAHGSEAPAFQADGDRYHVYEGPETRILDWMVRRADDRRVAGDYDCPSFLWPAGRTWCISTPFHSPFALVGAPLRAIEELLRIPGVYSARIAANDSDPGGSG